MRATPRTRALPPCALESSREKNRRQAAQQARHLTLHEPRRQVLQHDAVRGGKEGQDLRNRGTSRGVVNLPGHRPGMRTGVGGGGRKQHEATSMAGTPGHSRLARLGGRAGGRA